MRSSRLPLLALLLTVGASTLGAQVESRSLALPFLTQRASVNLLGIPFGLVSGEYEAFTTEEISFGAAAGIDENSETWLEAKGRYYPGASGARGLAVGMSLGLHRLRGRTPEDCFIICDDASGPLATGFTVGAIVDYSWLLGRRERFYIGTGIGAKRVFGLDDDPTATEPVEYRKVLPSFRFQTGFVF